MCADYFGAEYVHNALHDNANVCDALYRRSENQTFFVMALPVLALVPVLILIEPYRLKRLLAFIDPWQSPLGEGYQLIQSFYSLGSGGLFGLGLFNSRQKYMFLPFPRAILYSA